MSGQLPGAVKRLIPRSLKRAAKGVLLARTFRRAVAEVMSLEPGRVPSRETLGRLLTGWDNDGMAADLDYVEEVARMATETEGPVLECGSGLTTVILGLLAGRRGVSTWSMEHHPEWQARVAGILQQHNIPGVNVCLAPLKDYGQFSWYELPATGLPDKFRLVICDGPPESTPGGRYGLVPVIGSRLAVGAQILLDDANRPSESEALRRWAAETGASVSLREMPTGSFALVTCR